MPRKKADRNAGLTQLTLPGVKLADPEVQAMAMAFAADADVGETEPLGPVKWVPPHHPTLEGAGNYGSTVWSEFDYWWASIETQDPAAGWWAHLFEWDATVNDWRFVTKLHDLNFASAHKKARALARKLLVNGERPQAEAKSPELAKLVAYWREHGTHLLARDG